MYMRKLKNLVLGFILSVLFFLLYTQPIFADPIGTWMNATNFPVNIASHTSTSVGNNIFVFGGANFDDFSEVYSASQNPDGSITTWGSISNLPETRYWSVLAKKDNRVYILGGTMWTGVANYKNNVYSAMIQMDGSLPSWQTMLPLPNTRALGAGVIVGNRIYYAGGFNNSGEHNEIYYADINPDGTLGSWTTSAVSLPEPLSGFGMVEYNNNLIIVGGSNGSVYRNKTYKASFNSDGSLSTFTETAVLPEPVYRSGVIRIGSTLVSIGGYTGINTLDKIYYATINSDGTIEPWQLSGNHIPQPVCCGAIAYSNGFLYLTGGFGTSGYLDTVYYAPVNTILNVPLLKQTDPDWGEEIYDSANLWDPLSPTISAYGCAITSAAMVFNYYGLNTMPDGEPLNPKTLNDWLSDQQDKFFRNGSTNWAALSRLSKITKSVNPNFTHDALDITVSTYSKNLLLQDLMNGIPDILQAKMTSDRDHFFVARGTSGEDILINDPFEDESLLSFYGDKTKSMRRYIPTNTDLSYIILVVDKDINVSVSSSSGELVGEVFIEGPIENDLGTSEPEVFPLNIFYLKQPESTNYKVQLSSSSNTNYDLDAYFYDVEGNVQIEHVSGFIGPGASAEFDLDYSQDEPSAFIEVVTFEGLINDIKSLHSLNEINFKNYWSLLWQTRSAKLFSVGKFTKRGAVNILKSMDKQIFRAKGHGVSDNAYNILHNDIQVLLSSF